MRNIPIVLTNNNKNMEKRETGIRKPEQLDVKTEDKERGKNELLGENQVIIMGTNERPIYFGRDEDAGKFNMDFRWGKFVPKSEWENWGIQVIPRVYAKEIALIKDVDVKSTSDFDDSEIYSEGMWVSYEDLKKKYRDEMSQYNLDKAFFGETIGVGARGPDMPEEERKMYAVLVNKIVDTFAFVRKEEDKIEEVSKLDSTQCGKSVLLAIDDFIKKYPRYIRQREGINVDLIGKGNEILKSIKSKLTQEEWDYIRGDDSVRALKEWEDDRKKSIWRKKEVSEE